MKLTFIGGASTVTGSCYLIEVNDLKLLVECGMQQANGQRTPLRQMLPFDSKSIDYIFITHAHIDHSGLLPLAVKEGFCGKVISTPATRDLLEPMLMDSASIQENDADWMSRKNMRAGLPEVEPLYSTSDVRRLLPLFDVKTYERVFHLGSGIKYRFKDAGHILGSASIELWFQDSEREKKIVFSGDIGKVGSPILKDPLAPEEADYVVMESTYGNRTHRPFKESIDELIGAIKTTFKRGGNVYIPSFAVGRTQDLIYILNSLVRTKRLYRIDVYLDSPLAEEVTRVYLSHPECFDEEAKQFFSTRVTDDSVRLHFIRNVEESMQLNKIRSGVIVIAGSGMCEGGRMRHHLKHNLWREDCGIVFVGYQAEGTLGRRIVDGAKVVKILGEEVAVRASVYTINGFSAHADSVGLLGWLSSFNDSPEVFIVHGEEKSASAFESLVKEKFGFKTHRPANNDTFEL